MNYKMFLEHNYTGCQKVSMTQTQLSSNTVLWEKN